MRARDDEANFYDTEGTRSEEELQSISGRGAVEVNLCESSGAFLFVARGIAQGQVPRETEETDGPSDLHESSARGGSGVRSGTREEKRAGRTGNDRSHVEARLPSPEIQRHFSNLRLKIKFIVHLLYFCDP